MLRSNTLSFLANPILIKVRTLFTVRWIPSSIVPRVEDETSYDFHTRNSRQKCMYWCDVIAAFSIALFSFHDRNDFVADADIDLYVSATYRYFRV